MVHVKDPNSESPNRRFVATQDTDIIGVEDVGKVKKGDIIRVNPIDIRPYIAGRILVPFATAVKEGLYPFEKRPPFRKIKEAIIGKSKTEDESSSKKETTPKDDAKLVGNKLRDMIQSRKEEIKKEESKKPAPKTKPATTKPVSKDKLAAIRSGGKK